MLFGFLDREGMRLSEALALCWRDVDLTRGAVKLDRNKTDDARSWALHPGVTRALVAWKARRTPKGAKPDDMQDRLIFCDDDGTALVPYHLAEVFRHHLHAAGVTRTELFDGRNGRVPVRVHDLRATFVTVSLANGKTEAWVSARTGHKSSQMIAKYRRATMQIEELGLGDLLPLDDALPELRSDKPDAPPEPPATPPTQRAATRELVAALVAGALSRAPAKAPPRRASTGKDASTEGGTRTLTPFRTADFESAASTVPPLRLACASLLALRAGLREIVCRGQRAM